MAADLAFGVEKQIMEVNFNGQNNSCSFVCSTPAHHSVCTLPCALRLLHAEPMDNIHGVFGVWNGRSFETSLQEEKIGVLQPIQFLTE